MLWQLTHLSLSLLAGLARVVGTDQLPWARCDLCQVMASCTTRLRRQQSTQSSAQTSRASWLVVQALRSGRSQCRDERHADRRPDSCCQQLRKARGHLAKAWGCGSWRLWELSRISSCKVDVSGPCRAAPSAVWTVRQGFRKVGVGGSQGMAAWPQCVAVDQVVARSRCIRRRLS